MDSVGEGEGGMIWENGIEICIKKKKKALCFQRGVAQLIYLVLENVH